MEGVGLSGSFWRGRRVLITGHTGFKGAWLCLLLQELGADLTGYANGVPTQPALFELTELDQQINSIRGDVRNFDHLLTAVRETLPEIVIHMAAQSLVRKSYRDPVETYSTNVMGTVHLLEAIRQSRGVRAVVNVTSDKCYENRDSAQGHLETDPLGGDDPYSSSKACAEMMTQAYRRSFFCNTGHPQGVATATVRAGNVIGGGDWAPDRLIPDCMRSLAAGKTIEIRNPLYVRPWQFVLDPLWGYLLVAEKLCRCGESFAEAWNFGPRASDAQPVGVVADRVTELWGAGAAWKPADDPELRIAQPREAHSLKLDCGKARQRLGWMPQVDLDTALQWTVTWYRAFQQRQNPTDICRQQIAQFLSLGKTVTWAKPDVGFAKAG